MPYQFTSTDSLINRLRHISRIMLAIRRSGRAPASAMVKSRNQYVVALFCRLAKPLS